MRDCAGVRERLVDLIENELAAEERRDIEAHLGRCLQCAQESRELRETLEHVRALPEPAVPDGLLDGFAAAVQRRIENEMPQQRRVVRGLRRRLAALPSLRPIPALSAAGILGVLLAIGLVRAPRNPQPAPVPEVLVVGESLSIAQNLDVLQHFDVLEELDTLEQLPLLRGPENGRPLTMS